MGSTESGLPYGAGKFVYAPFSSHAVREATSALVTQILPDAHKYDLGVLDDTSGRLLGKVAMYAVNAVRESKGLPRAKTRFIADASKLPQPEKLWRDAPRESTPLIVTNSVDSGDSMAAIVDMLGQAGFDRTNIGMASLDVQGKRLKPEHKALFDEGIGKWYYLSLNRSANFLNDDLRDTSIAGMNGVAQRGGPFAVRANLVDDVLSDVPYLRAVREDCKMLARQIVAEYFRPT